MEIDMAIFNVKYCKQDKIIVKNGYKYNKKRRIKTCIN